MIFLYGIIKGRDPKLKMENFETRGIDQAKVYVLSYKDLQLLISPCYDTFTGNSLSRETLVSSLIDYQKFLESVLKTKDVIPFKFGTLVQDEKEVLKLLKIKYQTFKSLLNLYQGLCEFSVTATWLNSKAVFEALLGEDHELCELKRKAEVTQNSTDKIKVGQRLQTVLLSKNKEIDTIISAAIKKISQDSTSHEKLDDFMIYHESHLVQKRDTALFYECLEELNQTLNERAKINFHGQVQFKAIGPLPVYSFATVFVQRIAKADLEKAQSLLGIGSSSSFEELQKAYTGLMSIFHPDVDPHHEAKKFEEIRSAYKLLSECYKGAKIFSRDEDYMGVEIKKAD